MLEKYNKVRGVTRAKTDWGEKMQRDGDAGSESEEDIDVYG